MTFFGLGLWRLPELATKQDLRELELKIMPTQAEIVIDLRNVKDQLTAVSALTSQTVDEVTKVGTETDNLQSRIVVLEAAVSNQTNASAELVAAVQSVKEQAGVVASGVDTLAAGVKAVDDKVPDAPVADLPPPPAPPEGGVVASGPPASTQTAAS